ncbi:anion exchange family protein [Terfezia boudieri ATCC MYA-4762]|uniref:Anion exchange family protein n=1 Tax=Terfezia boudieri ATCC MYA-4762 TaxID=1051890 RepID=A0A3N4LR34_9PEZI|nr:anion exchange family protein [Terfezia boudieri ATCC MYA-4762]
MTPPEVEPQLKVLQQQPQNSHLDDRLPRLARSQHGDGKRRGSIVSRKRPHWPLDFFGIRWGEGMLNDVRARAPYYWSDWADAWNYRVIPSTVYMYFANLLPALAFSFDMFESTGMSYGVNEVLLSSFLGASAFSFFAAQPLVIVGVTGPITVFNYTVYDIVADRGTPYLPFMAWICFWSMIMHFFLGIANSSNAVRWVTRFSCDIFGFYVAFIYLQKGVQILALQWHSVTNPDASAYLSISIGLMVLVVGYLCGVMARSTLFVHPARTFLRDYGTPLTVVLFSGYQFIGKMDNVALLRLPTAQAFRPTLERGWLVRFWEIPTADIFLAIPFALLLTCLFYFDHNISSLIAQGTEFPLRKPSGFHWDIFLLGVTTGISGILGLPPPNGLIPQAPFHTASLCVAFKRTVPPSTASGEDPKEPCKLIEVTTHVVEQRFSNLAQGILILITMTRPLLSVLGIVPQAVLAGLFLVMGVQALEGNGITLKILYLLQDKALTPMSHPLRKCRLGAVWKFVILELVGFGAMFAITQTIAAVGFPVVVVALIPVRMYLLPKWFARGELSRLDQATASKFTLESVGGAWGGAGDEGYDDGDDGNDNGNDRNGQTAVLSGEDIATAVQGASPGSASSQSLTLQAQAHQPSSSQPSSPGGRFRQEGNSEDDVLERGDGIQQRNSGATGEKGENE